MNKEQKIVFLIKNNIDVLSRWLHEIAAFEENCFNNQKGRFLKETVHQLHLQKIILEEGWKTTFGKKENTLEGAKIFFSDDVSKTQNNYDLEIEGLKISLKGGQNKVLKREDRIKNSLTEKCYLSEFDFLIQYSPCFSIDKPGSIGISSYEKVLELKQEKSDAITLKISKKEDFLIYEVIQCNRQILSMGASEYERILNDAFRKISDSVDSKKYQTF